MPRVTLNLLLLGGEQASALGFLKGVVTCLAANLHERSAVLVGTAATLHERAAALGDLHDRAVLYARAEVAALHDKAGERAAALRG